MNETDARRATEQFLEQYTNDRPEYWEGNDPRLWCQCAAKGDANSFQVFFCVADSESADDPVIHELAREAMEALYAAHPEMKAYNISYDVSK
jgi:hypothetical protein